MRRGAVQFFGSNPHSNGDLFPQSSLIFFESNVGNVVNTTMVADNKMVTAAVVIIIIITYLVFHKFC